MNLVEISIYVDQIERRKSQLEANAASKYFTLTSALKTLKNGRKASLAEALGGSGGLVFYILDPTLISTLAYFGFALPILSFTKWMTGDSRRMAKYAIEDFQNLQKEIKDLEQYRKTALEEVERRQLEK